MFRGSSCSIRQLDISRGIVHYAVVEEENNILISNNSTKMVMNSSRRQFICRRGRAVRPLSLIPSLLLFAVVFTSCTNHNINLVNAALFNKKDKDGDTNSKPTSNNPSNNNEPPSRPPSIIEAEARTARELSKAVSKMSADLDQCNTRVNAIQDGFQDLYTAHLGNVDGLRKCKEGMLTKEEMQKLDDSLNSVNPALVEQATKKEDERLKHERIEAITEKHRELIHELENQVQKLVARELTWERTISELVARRDLLEQREGAWERTIGELMGEIELREKREGWWEEMKDEMETRIGALSQIAVLERFGPGPYFVSMEVLLDEGDPKSEREIIFELAPLQVMPHSIHLFLSQIAEGYWKRGTPSIAINAGHVLQACPHPCLESTDMGGNIPGYPYDEMRKEGLDVVSFQEYSTSYPHAKYTIGFAGKPSGPEFFINMMDNTLDHGTIEERKYKMGKWYLAWAKEVGLDEVSEKEITPYPCFGKVIKGFSTVNEVAKGLTRGSLPKDDESKDDLDDSILLRPIKIASMTILENYNPDEMQQTANDEL